MEINYRIEVPTKLWQKLDMFTLKRINMRDYGKTSKISGYALTIARLVSHSAIGRDSQSNCLDKTSWAVVQQRNYNFHSTHASDEPRNFNSEFPRRNFKERIETKVLVQSWNCNFSPDSSDWVFHDLQYCLDYSDRT